MSRRNLKRKFDSAEEALQHLQELPSQDLEMESDEEEDQNDKDWSADLPSESEEEYEYRYENDNPYIEMMEELRNSNQSNTTPRLVLVTDGEPSTPNQGIETVNLEEEQSSRSVIRRPSAFTRKHSGGREKSRIWEEFTEVDEKTWKCKHCAHVFKHPQANRLQKHLNKCSKKKPRANPSPTSVPVSTSSDVLVCQVSDAQNPSMSQRTLEQCTPRTSSQLKHQMDEALLKMICSTNSSFNMVENKEFKAFINLARGSYEVPTRKYIGETMLEKVYNKEMSKFSSFVKRKRATILQDGWKAPQGDCVIAHSLTIEGRNYFFNSHVMGEEKKTSENCLRLLIQAIEKAESMGVHVTSCVTDNCASMKLMRNLLKAKLPTILTYGCNSHLLNLIGKKITPEELMQKVVLVQKYVSNHDITKAALKNIQGLSPVLPSDTRWNSQLSCLENYYRNHAKYLEISRREDIPISSTVLDIVENQSVVPEVKGLINMLKPVALSLDMLQGDKSTVADAVHCWLGLQRDSKLDKRNSDGSYFKEKFDEGTPNFAIAAYMVHPKYQGRHLTVEMATTGRQFFREKDRTFLPIVLGFKTMNTNMFSSMLFEEDILSMDPVCWWKTAHSDNPNEVTKEFLSFITTLLSLPSSTAGIERNFSAMGAIYSDKHRNKLSVEKADKLCFIKNSFTN